MQWILMQKASEKPSKTIMWLFRRFFEKLFSDSSRKSFKYYPSVFSILKVLLWGNSSGDISINLPEISFPQIIQPMFAVVAKLLQDCWRFFQRLLQKSFEGLFQWFRRNSFRNFPRNHTRSSTSFHERFSKNSSTVTLRDCSKNSTIDYLRKTIKNSSSNYQYIRPEIHTTLHLQFLHHFI